MVILMQFIKNLIKRKINSIGFEINRFNPIKDNPFNIFKLIIENMY